MKFKESTFNLIYNFKSPAILRSIFDLLIRSSKKFARDDGGYLAAGMSYYIFFSVFPFLLGLLAFLGIFFGSEKATEQVKDVLERQLPGIADSPIIYDNLQSIDFNKGLVGALAVIGLLWTGSAVFGSLTRMMNKIWNLEDKRSFYNRKGTDMIFTILIGLVLSTNTFINSSVPVLLLSSLFFSFNSILTNIYFQISTAFNSRFVQLIIIVPIYIGLSILIAPLWLGLYQEMINIYYMIYLGISLLIYSFISYMIQKWN